MALLSIFRGTQAECSARPVSDGTLLFATDTKKIYLDKDSSRIEMSSVDDLGNYVTKEQLTTALNGKANTTHTHTQDQITGLKDALAGKASTSHSHSAASSSMSGFMSAADKQKLDGIAAGANKYTLPAASSTALGGVKVGKNLTIAEDGTLSADEQITVIDSKDIDASTFYDVVKEKWPQIIVREGNYTLWPQAYLNDRLTPYTYDSYLFSNLACNLNEELGSTISGYVEGLLVMKGDILWPHTALLSCEQLNWDYLKNRPFTYIGNGLKVDSFFGESVLSVTNYNDLATNSSVASAVNAMGSTKANASHTHSTSDITDFPTLATVATSGSYSDLNDKPTIPTIPSAIKNPSALTISLNGTSQGAYDGSAAKSINVTPASIGAAASSHNHDASNITSGTLSADRIPTITDGKIQSVSASKITGTIPQSILPSYVDDVLEYENLAAFPKTGESGKIYVADDTNKTYRWSGTAYVEISASLALGTTSSTAFRGDYGNTAYAHAQAKGSAFSSGLYKITTNSQGHVTAATAVTKSDITALGIPGSDTNTNTTYSLSKSGSTITLKGSDGSTTSVTDADTNTTYPTFKGATTSAAGGTGLVPAPATGAANRYLRSDGTWQVPPDNNTTYPNMGGASSNAAGHAGLVPAPAAGASNRYLRSDGTWSVPPDNNTNTTYSLSKNGSTITLTGSDGSKTSVTDSNTTYSLSSFGVNASATELNYVKGVTSSIQTQLNSKAASNHTHSNYLTTTGTAAAATKLATARSISIVGDSFGSASFDGTSNINIDTIVLQHRTTDIPANADLNSYTYPGWYRCIRSNDVKTLSNRPGNNAFAMVVLSGAGITQIVFEYMTSGYKIYTRNKYGTTWGSWGRVYTTENKPTYSEIGAAAASHSHSNYLTTSGTAAAASKLATARTISLAGDVTGSANFDGSTNISITGNIAAGTVGANELLDGAVTNAKIAADSVSLEKLGSDVGTVAVQSSEPSDPNVKLWIQI